MSHNQAGTVPASASSRSNRAALLMLLKRIHLYIGLFIGPFIFIAALTGVLYVVTPQLENHWYANLLLSNNSGPQQPLSQQVEAALQVAGPKAHLFAVRPAVGNGTTRVMFNDPALAPSETRAWFIDPVTSQVQGSSIVYGSSGVLPLRTWLDNLHRSLHLGAVGRIYSELAASWLWVAALGGLVLWFNRRRQRVVRIRDPQAIAAQRSQRWHSWLGLTLLLGLLFLSVTGLTWSEWAGNNISQLRSQMGWMTPSLHTALRVDMPGMDMGEHAEHQGMMMMDPAPVAISPIQFDQVLATARAAGIAAAKIEIRPAYSAEKAWTVTEIDTAWPTQIDAVAVDPASLKVVDHIEFAHFSLVAKLTRWGIDAHMGVLFGLANQLLLVLFGLGICGLIGCGYRLWWLRRPKGKLAKAPLSTLLQTWLHLPTILKLALAVLILLLGYSLPVMGISLLLLLLIEQLRWHWGH